MEIHKITHGFVTQKWDAETGKFLGQEFTAGDEVEYEDENGDSIDEQEPEYRPFDMVQNPEPGETYLSSDDDDDDDDELS